jgi:hypothetical protein
MQIEIAEHQLEPLTTAIQMRIQELEKRLEKRGRGYVGGQLRAELHSELTKVRDIYRALPLPVGYYAKP